jgi:acyl-CoA dehydrogenase
MDFELSALSEGWRKKLQGFFEQEVLPRHRDWLEHVVRKGAAAPFMAALQQNARDAGLWNLGLPELSPESRARGCQISNTRRSPRSWADYSGRPKSSIARRQTCQT